MTDTTAKPGSNWQDVTNLLLGCWLFFSPGILDFNADPMATWTTVGLGTAVIGFAVAAMHSPRKWLEWAVAVTGVCLLAAPWVLGFHASPNATWNDAVVGGVIAVLALWRIYGTHGRGPIPAAS
jgi:hypothetical protein